MGCVNDPNEKLLMMIMNMNEMNIGGGSLNVKKKESEKLTKLWCIFIPTAVQEMIDLEQLHLAIACVARYNTNTL